MKAYRDTDYLHATARVRALENGMVTRRDFQKMIDAKTAEEAYKVLSDAPICHGVPMEGYEAALEQNLLDAYQLLDRIAPGSGLTQLFRCQYDGHNLKTAIKARRATGDVSGVYSGLGNLPAKEITAQLESGRLTGIPTPLAQAALEASEALAKTGDPQAVDILLDRGILASMAQQAEKIPSPFLQKYVAAQIDIANIRAAVRLGRMGKNAFFLGKVLAPGGRIPLSAITEAYTKTYEGPAGGSNTVEYTTGDVRVIEASCPDHVCIGQGWLIEDMGSILPIACLPNAMMINVISLPEASESPAVDGATQ